MKLLEETQQEAFRTSMGSEKVFITYEWIWYLMGQKPDKHVGVYRWLYCIYSVLFNVSIVIGFPVFLNLALFYIDSTINFFQIFTVSFSSIMASVKSLNMWWRFEQIEKIRSDMRKLDERVQEKEDVDYYKKHVLRSTYFLVRCFSFLLLTLFITLELSALVPALLGHSKLMFDVNFPFDTSSSKSKYVIIHLQQMVGVAIHCSQNCVSDTYPAVNIAYMAGHVRLLGRRVMRIGYNESKTQSENNETLVECIKDHKLILTYHHTLMKVISFNLFCQVLVTAVSTAIGGVFILFFEVDRLTLVSTVVYLSCMPLEIFPSCFYGSQLKEELYALTNVIGKCNWVDQSKNFKQNLRIFLEQTLRSIDIVAGGMIKIDLPVFVASCKMTYSMFMVILQMK